MRSVKGFTLIELMIVVVLLGIFASLAVPAFSSLIANNRVEGAASEFYQLLMSARSEAVTKRDPATLSKVTDTNWRIQQGGETVREVTLPTNVTLSGAPASLIFRADGTAASANMTVGSEKSSKSFLITVQPSGAIRMSGATSSPP